ncbi:ANTAR domain-containing protein [Cellulomonas cellasea]|nr:ANTAR domain-containing protein [Cellulomonas cellasea]GEA87779.1 transcription antitermination regulator [Cellulomonas cellasea]
MQLSLEHAEAVGALQDALAAATGVDELLGGVVLHAAAHVPDGVHVAVTVHRTDRDPRSAGSSPGASSCVEAELGSYDGPSVTSVAQGHRVVVVDVDAEAWWPAWRSAAVAAGFRTAAVVTRTVREECAVTFTVLSERQESWDADALVRTELYVQEVARALEVCLRWADGAELAADLRSTLAGRAVIDQAVGVIMAENRCSAEDARAVLESASVNRNVDPRDVAAALIESVTGVAPSVPAEFVARPAARPRASRRPRPRG